MIIQTGEIIFLQKNCTGIDKSYEKDCSNLIGNYIYVGISLIPVENSEHPIKKLLSCGNFFFPVGIYF